MSGKRDRLDRLEAARRKWEAEHVPLPHVFAYLLDVLSIVQEEAGTAAFSRVAGRMVGEKLRRVEALRGRGRL